MLLADLNQLFGHNKFCAFHLNRKLAFFISDGFLADTGPRAAIAPDHLARITDEARHAGVVVGLANHTILVARYGTERPIEDSAAPIKDSHGAVQGCILVFHDVTEKRRSLRALRQSEASLKEANVRKEATKLLAQLNLPNSVALLEKAATEEGPIPVRQHAIEALALVQAPDAERALGKLMDALLSGQLPAALAKGLAERTRPTVLDVVVTRDPARMLPAVDNRTVEIRQGDRVA